MCSRRARTWALLSCLIALAPGCAARRAAMATRQPASAPTLADESQVVAQYESQRDLAQFEAACTHLAAGQREGCRELIEDLVHRNPGHRDARLLLAQLYLEEDRPLGALEQVELALARWPNDAAVWHTMGLVLEASGQSAAALEHFRRAASLDPTSELFQLSYQTARDSARGVSAASAAGGSPATPVAPPGLLPSAPVSAIAGANPPPAHGPALANSLAPTNRLAHTNSYEPTSAPAPTNGAAPAPLAPLPGAASPLLAYPHSHAEAAWPEEPVALTSGAPGESAIVPTAYSGADVAVDTPRAEEALAPPQAADTERPARRLVAPVVDGAVEPVSQSIPHDLPFTAAEQFIDHGGRLLAAGARDSAIEWFEQGLSMAPDDPQLAVSAVVAALRAGQPEMALKLAEPAQARFPDSAPIHRAAGLAHFRLGRFDASQVALQQALSLDNSDALAYFLLSATLSRMGRAEEAAWHLRRAREIEPKWFGSRGAAP